MSERDRIEVDVNGRTFGVRCWATARLCGSGLAIDGLKATDQKCGRHRISRAEESSALPALDY